MMMKEDEKALPVSTTTEKKARSGRKAFVTPAHEARGDLKIHFCSGINLWDGTGGTLQCN